MRKIISFFSKGTAFVYVFLKYKFKKKMAVGNKKVLILLAGHLGNAIMNVESVLEFQKVFDKRDGWSIDIICSRRLWKTCNLIADMSGFNYLDIDYVDAGNGTDFKTVHRTIKAVKNLAYEKIIVTLAGNSPLANYVVAAVPHNESIAAFDDVQSHKGLRWYFQRAYTKRLVVSVDDHDTVRLKKIIQYFAGNDYGYKIKIHYVPKLCDYKVPQEKYITLAVDSFVTDRRWPAESFAELVNLLTDQYDYLVCFTGGDAGQKIYESIIPMIKKPEQTRNYISQTTVAEWFELLRGAEFHIGVDSGSIHVAAAVGTKAFCLVGHEVGNRALPYATEQAEPTTQDPICIYRSDVSSLPCYACKAKYGRTGRGNDECYKACLQGKPSLCFSKITPEEVFKVIKENT